MSSRTEPSRNAGARATAALPQLLDLDNYTPCDWDLTIDHEGRELWLDIFEAQVDHIAAAARQSDYTEGDIAAARAEILEMVRAIRADPTAIGERLDILAIDRRRDGALRERGIEDPFRAVKSRENDRALADLDRRCAEIDGLPEEERLAELIRGVFAGNLFDMGAQKTAELFMGAAGPEFHACLDRVPGRPWGVDDLDRATLDGFGRAVLFVDNAGADIVLGMLPLARELARRGTRVTLAANELPSLNDVTAEELRELLDRAAPLGEHVESGAIVVESTGSADPLIDLGALDPGFCERAAGADLVVLEGMGRGLESNWEARLSCETWRMAIVKVEPVAARRGVRMFDGIFRRDAPQSAPAT